MNPIIQFFILVLILLLSCLFLYFPLFLFTKNKYKSLVLSPIFSLSIEIIFGYFFYCTNKLNLFVPTFICFSIILNSFVIIKLLSLRKRLAINVNRNIFIWLILICITVYTRFYDSINFVAFGATDTFNHLQFLLDLKHLGYLSDPYYVPGFHLILYPLLNYVDISTIGRFAGPVLGLIFTLNIVLFFKNSFKNKLIPLLLLSLFSFPLFNQLNLQLISFFPSSFSILFIAYTIYLITQRNYSKKTFLIFSLIPNIALALTVPYFFVQLIPTLLISFLIIFSTKFLKDYIFANISIFLLIAILGFFISFLHIFIQSSILKRPVGFPEISIAIVDSHGNTIVTNNMNVTGKITGPFTFLIKSIPPNSYLKPLILPMLATGNDILSVKNIRNPGDLLSSGSYLWIATSIIFLFYSYRNKKRTLLLICIFSLSFGLATQTGIFEMSFYRGRSGWYLLLLCLIGICLIIDNLPFRGGKYLIYSASFLIALSGILKPPIFYRPYYPEYFNLSINISRFDHHLKVCLYTNQTRVSILIPQIILFSGDINRFFESSCDTKYIILEKKYLEVDPVMSQDAISTDKNFQLFYTQQNSNKTNWINNIYQIRTNPEFRKFKLIWQNANLELYSQNII